MNKGQGNIARTNKVEAPVIPPPPVTGANNGLTLVGTTIQLGGANPLLHNTNIDPGNFDLQLSDGGFKNFLSLKPSINTYGIGDLSGFNNRTSLFISDNVKQAQISSIGFSMLFLDMASGIFQLGASAGGTANKTFLQVNDPVKQIETSSSGFVNGILLDLNNLIFEFGDFSPQGNGTGITITDSVQVVRAGKISSPSLYLDEVNRDYSLGDSFVSHNGVFFEADDVANAARVFVKTGVTSGQPALILNGTAGTYQIGDINNLKNGNNLIINDTAKLYQFRDFNFRYMELDVANKVYSIGDIDGAGNNTFMQADDATGHLNLFAINGVGINIVPTASPFAVLALPAFANNAAAVVGGLAVGDFYRISLAGTSTVAVVQ